jgi:hypothetical protein
MDEAEDQGGGEHMLPIVIHGNRTKQIWCKYFNW